MKHAVYAVFCLISLVFACLAIDSMKAGVSNAGYHTVTRKNFTMPYSVVVGDWEIKCSPSLWKYLKVGSRVRVLEKRGFFGVYGRRITLD